MPKAQNLTTMAARKCAEQRPASAWTSLARCKLKSVATLWFDLTGVHPGIEEALQGDGLTGKKGCWRGIEEGDRGGR